MSPALAGRFFPLWAIWETLLFTESVTDCSLRFIRTERWNWEPDKSLALLGLVFYWGRQDARLNKWMHNIVAGNNKSPDGKASSKTGEGESFLRLGGKGAPMRRWHLTQAWLNWGDEACEWGRGGSKVRAVINVWCVRSIKGVREAEVQSGERGRKWGLRGSQEFCGLERASFCRIESRDVIWFQALAHLSCCLLFFWLVKVSVRGSNPDLSPMFQVKPDLKSRAGPTLFNSGHNIPLNTI